MYPKITGRDIAVLLSLYTYRYLSASQVTRLHFPSKRTAWFRLKALTDLGCIKPFTVYNIPERIYYLDKKGAELVKAIVFYLRYWTSTKWQRYNVEFDREFRAFRTLIITTSEARIRHIREATTNYPFPQAQAKRFLWCTTEGQATKELLFEAIW